MEFQSAYEIMSEWDCQNFEESKQDENSGKPMLISLLLYTQLRSTLTRIECLLIVFSLLNGPVDLWYIAARCLSQRPVLSGLHLYALLLQQVVNHIP